MVVEITNARDPAKTVIGIRERDHSGGCFVETVVIKMSEGKEVLFDLIEERTILGKPKSLPLRLRYHPETGSASIREVIEGRYDRIKEFYDRLWFGNESSPRGGLNRFI